MEGGLPYTPWAKGVRDARLALNASDNPDAMCLPMGFLQFHQQPQPRKIYQTPKEILIEYEANYGLRHIYLDGRKLPPQGEPQPFWYGYSVGRWEGDTLVVETNNLRGAEDGPYDGWLDVNGSPLQPAGEVHRALPPPRRTASCRSTHGRGSEGVHEAVDGPRRSAHHARRGDDRVRLQREPAVPPQGQDRLGSGKNCASAALQHRPQRAHVGESVDRRGAAPMSVRARVRAEHGRRRGRWPWRPPRRATSGCAPCRAPLPRDPKSRVRSVSTTSTIGHPRRQQRRQRRVGRVGHLLPLRAAPRRPACAPCRARPGTTPSCRAASPPPCAAGRCRASRGCRRRRPPPGPGGPPRSARRRPRTGRWRRRFSIASSGAWIGVPTLHFLMSVLTTSKRPPSPSASTGRVAVRRVHLEEVVGAREHVVHAVPAGADEQRRRDAVARRHAAEHEALLDVVGVAAPHGIPACLLRRVVEQPAHLPRVEPRQRRRPRPRRRTCRRSRACCGGSSRGTRVRRAPSSRGCRRRSRASPRAGTAGR